MGLFNSFSLDSGFTSGREKHFFIKCNTCNKVVRDDHFIKNWRHEDAEQSESELRKHRQDVARFDNQRNFKMFGR